MNNSNTFYKNFTKLSLLLLVFWGCSNKNKKTSDSDGEAKGGITEVSDNILSGDLKFPKTYFSNPKTIKKGDTSRIIVDNLIKYIDAAVRNSDIYFNIYQFEDKPLARSLVRADARGVDVHVLIDSSKTNSWKKNKPIAQYLQDSLGSSPGSEVVMFHNDVAEASINHHKHLLLSEVATENGNLKDIIFTTSSNFSNRQFEVLQDAIVFDEGKGLYNATLSNWKKMKSYAQSGTKNNYSHETFTTHDRDRKSVV